MRVSSPVQVRDTAAFYAAAECFYKNPRLPGLGQVQHAAKARLRIAFVENSLEGSAAHQDADTWRTQQETAALLQSLGHQVDQIPMPVDVDGMIGHYLIYYGFLAYMVSHWGRLLLQAKVDRRQLEPFTLGLSQEFKTHPLKLFHSIRTLRNTAVQTERLFERYDVLMTPVGARRTPKIGYFSAKLPYEEVSRRAVAFGAYCGLQNVTGSPAISLPLGVADDDMPLGVHFAAPCGHERRLLELAFELEEAKPWRSLSDSSYSPKGIACSNSRL